MVGFTCFNINRFFIALFVTCFLTCGMSVKAGIVELYSELNPVKNRNSISVDESISLHQKFVIKSKAEANLSHEIMGNIYLFHDYKSISDLSKAQQALLEAEKLAQLLDDPLWLGWVGHQKGVFYIIQRNYSESLRNFNESISYLKATDDSVLLALTYDQAAASYSNLEKPKEAEQLFNKALHLLSKKKGTDKYKANIHSNFATFYSKNEDYVNAMKYFELAVAYYESNGETERKLMTLNNIGDSYFRLGQYDNAKKLFLECERQNKSNGFSRNLITNYSNLYEVFKVLGDSKQALLYKEKHEMLYDSIMGVDKQLNILRKDYDIKIDKLQSEKVDIISELLKNKKRSLKIGIISICILAFLLFVIYRLTKSFKGTTNDLSIKEQKVQSLLQTLKNLTTDDTLNVQGKRVIDIDPYKLRILTSDDWLNFKSIFESNFPGFINALRNRYPNLSEGEERLFLLIKLNLSNTEIKNILGISEEGVKKAKFRLKKRIELTKGQSLDDFILNFGGEG